MKPTYKEQLLDPKWQRKRLERLSLSDFACDRCGDKETTLHVHHRNYFRGRMAWEYTTDELQTLCKQCHEGQHADQETLQMLAQRADSGGMSLQDINSLLAGYLYAGRFLGESDIADLNWSPFWESGIAAYAVLGHARTIVREAVRGGDTNPILLSEVLAWDEHEAHYINGTLSKILAG